MKYDSRPRTRGTFILTGLEHRGVRPADVVLVFYVAGVSGRLAVWGAPRLDMRHILDLEESIERSGYPVRIECDWIEPDEYEARTFHHRFWVLEKDHFAILRRDSASERGPYAAGTLPRQMR